VAPIHPPHHPNLSALMPYLHSAFCSCARRAKHVNNAVPPSRRGGQRGGSITTSYPPNGLHAQGRPQHGRARATDVHGPPTQHSDTSSRAELGYCGEPWMLMRVDTPHPLCWSEPRTSEVASASCLRGVPGSQRHGERHPNTRCSWPFSCKGAQLDDVTTRA
jgi:hypothetical protein